jgi:YidC/Oxa1 family membrane protein insertase
VPAYADTASRAYCHVQVFPTSFELRQESFLWATDLSTYDSIFDLPFTIPWYGSHVSLFTLLMAISTVIYTRMNSQMTAGSSQMPGMQTMMYMMPVMMLFIFNSFASALSYYYFLTNMITFGQQAIIKRFVNDEELLRRINEHKEETCKQIQLPEKA